MPGSKKKNSVPRAEAVSPAKPRFDPRKHEGPLPTPCTGVCVMDGRTGFCQGCLRTIEEIAEWGSASEARKRQVWIMLEQRRAVE